MLSDPVDQDIKESLDAVHAQRERVAQRLSSPGWYHPVLGLLAGAVVASWEARSIFVAISVEMLVAVGIGVLIGVYKQHNGVWVNGWRWGRAGRWTLALVAGCAGLAGLAALAEFVLGWRGAFVAGGALTVPWVTVAGRHFDEALGCEVRSEP